MKHKFRTTLILEYEADSEDYDTDEPLEMASIDKENLLYQDSVMIGDNFYYGNEIVTLKVELV